MYQMAVIIMILIMQLYVFNLLKIGSDNNIICNKVHDSLFAEYIGVA